MIVGGYLFCLCVFIVNGDGRNGPGGHDWRWNPIAQSCVSVHGRHCPMAVVVSFGSAPMGEMGSGWK